MAFGVAAQSLQLANVNYPGIYCRFDPNCNVTPREQSDTYASTNVPITCVLESRSFSGNSQDSQGQYGYEYRITLNNNTANSAGGTAVTNVLTVDSLALHFGQPDTFAFGMHASNEVWVVTTGGPAGLPPASVELSGQRVFIHFAPPLTLETDTDQTTNTCYIGMISDRAPEMTTAIISGSTQDPDKGTLSFKAKLQAQTP